jgi:soluble lytic murein transglycosylase-like protein
MTTQGISPVTPRSNSAQSSSPEQIRKVAQEFETLFSSMMLRSMRKTIGENPLIPQSTGEDIFTGMLDDEYSKMLSSNTSMGLADMIVKEIAQNENPGSALKELLNIGKTRSWSTDPRFLPKTTGATDATTTPVATPKDLSEKVSRWDDLISRAGRMSGVDKNLISAIVTQESGGDHLAVSPKGAKGLMQLMDTTAATLGVGSPFSPWANISGGTKYLKQMLDRFNGNEQLAVAAYNAGPAAVERYGTVPPYTETQNYVKSVLALRQHLAAAAPASGEEK